MNKRTCKIILLFVPNFIILALCFVESFLDPGISQGYMYIAIIELLIATFIGPAYLSEMMYKLITRERIKKLLIIILATISNINDTLILVVFTNLYSSDIGFIVYDMLKISTIIVLGSFLLILYFDRQKNK